MKLRLFFSSILLSFLLNSNCFGWGDEGHAIVGRIAMKFVTADVRQNILAYLGKMPIDSAANWMDKMKSNPDYDFMRSWHYVDFPKGQLYVENNSDNIINHLQITFNELAHKKTLCDEQIRTDLFILIHLMGDLHMPLHSGYEDDLGGNKRIVQFDTVKTHNLHRYWDEDIIRLSKMTDEDCLQFYNNDLENCKKVDFTAWMMENRNLLDGVYDFPDFHLDNTYLNKNKIVVEKQLLKAGVRLAYILNKLFASPSPHINFQVVTEKYKNGIDIKDVLNNVGKRVTVCSRVFGVHSTPTITQINLGDRYPNSPLTVVVFPANYSKFKYPFDEMFKDKNICVIGTIELYKDKPQIIINNPEDLIIQ